VENLQRHRVEVAFDTPYHPKIDHQGVESASPRDLALLLFWQQVWGIVWGEGFAGKKKGLRNFP
jgi:hypothetical protein